MYFLITRLFFSTMAFLAEMHSNGFFSNLGANNSPEILWLIQIHAVYTSALQYVLNESKHTAGILQNVKITQNTGGTEILLRECGPAP